MKKFLSLLMMALLCVTTAWAETIILKPLNSSSCSISGHPSGVTATYSSSYGTLYQLTGGDAMTFTVHKLNSSYDVTGVSLHLKTNAKKGTGTAMVSYGSENWTYSIPVLGDTYVYKDVEINTFQCDVSKDLIINVSATTNSVYCDEVKITYETHSSSSSVAAPVFNPESGTVFTSNASIEITTETAGATIYYTSSTTGTPADPTSESDVYNAPIAISESTIFKAIAIKNGESSDVTTAEYTISSATGSNVFQRVESSEDIIAGKRYIIVCENSSGALSSPASLTTSGITLSGGTATLSGSSVTVYTLGKSGDYFNFMSNNSYIAWTGSTNVGISTSATDDKALWGLTINRAKELVAENKSSNRFLLFNDGITLKAYAAYNQSGSQKIQLYKEVEQTITSNINRIIQTNGESSTAGGWLGNWSENCTVGTDWQTNPAYSVTAPAGVTVQFKAGTNSNYQILAENVTAVDANNAIVPLTTVSTANDGITFSFTMPASAVTITANFTSYAPDVYFLAGNLSNWDNGTKMTYDSNAKKYRLRVYFADDEYGYFRFRAGNNSYASGASGDYWPISENNDGESHFGDEITMFKGSEKRFRIPAGIYDIEVGQVFTDNWWSETTVKVTKVEPTLTFTPADGSTVNQGTEVTVSSNLYSLLHAINSNVADNDVTNEVSLDGNTFDQSVTLSTPGIATVTGKATYGNIEVTSNASYTVAVFYNINCSVITTPSDKTGGAITSDKQTATAGETVTLTITTNAGYELDCVKLNGTAITGNTFEMPAADANVVAYFNAKTLNITVNNDDAKGVVSEIPATSTVSSEIEFTVTPHTGYTVNSVTCTFTPDGGNPSNLPVTTGENNTYSFKMPGYDVAIDVTYDEVIEGLIDPLFHETFGTNSSGARPWLESYSVKSGVYDVYKGITSYTVTNAKQSINSNGYEGSSGLAQSSQGTDASIIIGPLNVADYQNLRLAYFWKAGSIKGTYTTSAYYATSANGTPTELTGTGPNPTTASEFVERSYALPEVAQVSTLYLKIVFNTSNAQAVIDEVNLSGAPKRTTLKQIEETKPTGEVTIADDLQVVAIVDKEIDENTTIQVAFARDFAESINPASCPDGAVDFMRDMVYTEADLQAGPWQQNNWVMLDFTNVATTQFGALSENCVIKGGTLTGTYSDYTFQVSDDFTYQAGTAVGNYTPNVYCPANFHSNNTQTINVKIDGETVQRTFWFMTPKPMEVCKFTWAMYYNGNGYAEGFYMQDGDVKLLGGVGVDQTYNSDQTTLVNGESYRFTGVIMKTGQTSGAKDAAENHHPQDGSTLNTGYIVAPTNLTKAEGQVITALNEVKTGSDVVSVTYCDLAGRMSQKPFAGVNIIVTRYSDGTVKTTKAIK